MEFRVNDLTELNKVSSYIIDHLEEYPIVLFYGEMGVGKTTLISNLMVKLGPTEQVTSPTFALVNEYELDNEETAYHFDFYRINSEEEAMDIGVEEYFDSGNICFIEWPSKIPNLLPERVMKVNIELSDHFSRIFNVNLAE